VSNQSSSQLPPPPSSPPWQAQTWQPGSGRQPLPRGVEPQPTQRYDLAPNAPGYRAQGQQPSPFAAQQHSASGSSSQLFTPYPQRPARQEIPSPLDIVTIMLAILAFFSVACLIPLYIAVFQARFGG
jgi:hypothetical protein